MTDKTYQPFTKNINFEKSKIKIQVKIEFSAEGRLSIMGMIYEPNHYGRWVDTGGGQCQDTLYERFSKNQKARRLVEIWNRWHLNDMQAGCEHQRHNPAWDVSKDLGFSEYKLKYEMLKKRDELKERALADAQMDRSKKVHSISVSVNC